MLHYLSFIHKAALYGLLALLFCIFILHMDAFNLFERTVGTISFAMENGTISLSDAFMIFMGTSVITYPLFAILSVLFSNFLYKKNTGMTDATFFDTYFHQTGADIAFPFSTVGSILRSIFEKKKDDLGIGFRFDLLIDSIFLIVIGMFIVYGIKTIVV